MGIVAGLGQQMQQAATIKVMPGWPSWFRIDAVHEIERRALPEFFSGRSPYKTPTVYRECRDFMLGAAQQLGPSQPLTFTHCRRHLAGDACSIMRVHAFLEHWGLINAAAIKAQPSSLAPLEPPAPMVNPPPQLAPAPQQQAQQQQQGQSQAPSAAGAAGQQQQQGPQLAPLQLAPIAQHVHPQTVMPAPACVGASTAQAAQHAHKAASAGLETRMHVLGAVQQQAMLEGAVARSGEEEAWTDQETYLLLEAVEQTKGGDWDAVAQHVGTKTKQQCVAQFVRLPIEDPYLEDELSGVHARLRGVAPPEQRAPPLAPGVNPLPALVAFLASATSSAPVMHAVQKALEESTAPSEDDDGEAPSAKRPRTGDGGGDDSCAEVAAPATPARRGRGRGRGGATPRRPAGSSKYVRLADRVNPDGTPAQRRRPLDIQNAAKIKSIAAGDGVA
eukprot:m51a1_g13507 hypothetical protein (446) ;mRNA; r:871-3566